LEPVDVADARRKRKQNAAPSFGNIAGDAPDLESKQVARVTRLKNNRRLDRESKIDALTADVVGLVSLEILKQIERLIR